MLLYALLPLQHLWSRLASFQVLRGHVWLLSTVMNGAALAAVAWPTAGFLRPSGELQGRKAVPVDFFSSARIRSPGETKSISWVLILLSASLYGVFLPASGGSFFESHFFFGDSFCCIWELWPGQESRVLAGQGLVDTCSGQRVRA